MLYKIPTSLTLIDDNCGILIDRSIIDNGGVIANGGVFVDGVVIAEAGANTDGAFIIDGGVPVDGGVIVDDGYLVNYVVFTWSSQLRTPYLRIPNWYLLVSPILVQNKYQEVIETLEKILIDGLFLLFCFQAVMWFLTKPGGLRRYVSPGVGWDDLLFEKEAE